MPADMSDDQLFTKRVEAPLMQIRDQLATISKQLETQNQLMVKRLDTQNEILGGIRDAIVNK